MGTFDQKRFLNEHIPYRIHCLEACFHALRIIIADPPATSVKIKFDMGYEMVGPLALVTNGWIEHGLITCRVMHNFLTGNKGKRRKDDITIDQFVKNNGESLPLVKIEDIADFRPEYLSRDFVIKAIDFTLLHASKTVAHITDAEIAEGQDVECIQAACLTLITAIHVNLYDALGLQKPIPLVQESKRNERSLS
jgi:hypothetical protein